MQSTHIPTLHVHQQRAPTQKQTTSRTTKHLIAKEAYCCTETRRVTKKTTASQRKTTAAAAVACCGPHKSRAHVVTCSCCRVLAPQIQGSCCHRPFNAANSSSPAWPSSMFGQGNVEQSPRVNILIILLIHVQPLPWLFHQGAPCGHVRSKKVTLAWKNLLLYPQTAGKTTRDSQPTGHTQPRHNMPQNHAPVFQPS